MPTPLWDLHEGARVSQAHQPAASLESRALRHKDRGAPATPSPIVGMTVPSGLDGKGLDLWPSENDSVVLWPARIHLDVRAQLHADSPQVGISPPPELSQRWKNDKVEGDKA